MVYLVKRYHHTRAVLHARFPAAFPARGEPCVPLKMGSAKGLYKTPLHIAADRLRSISKRIERLDDERKANQALKHPSGLPAKPRSAQSGESAGQAAGAP